MLIAQNISLLVCFPEMKRRFIVKCVTDISN